MAIALQRQRSIDARAELVSRYVTVHRQLEQLEQERRELRDVLVQKGPGELRGTNGEAIQVIYPDPKIAIPQDDKIDMIRERIGDENFRKLVERQVVYKAVKSCREVARRILSKVQFRQFLGFTEVECSPYIRVS
jgi:hypothetical protein